MTVYERFRAQDAVDKTIEALWHPPLDVAVMQVDTARPSKGGLLAIRMPVMRGAVPQNIAALQQRAAAIRHVLATQQTTKDRGS